MTLHAIYHELYSAPLPSTHRFPMAKFRLLRHLLLDEQVLQANQIRRPLSIPRRDLERIHRRLSLIHI